MAFPNFFGKQYESASNFQDDLEMAFLVSGRDEEEVKLRAFPLVLKDSAKNWFQNLEPGRKTNWETVKETFLSKYGGLDNPEHLWHRISSLHQATSRTYLTYESQFLRLWAEWEASLAEGERAPNFLKKEKFLAGLFPDLQEKVKGKFPETFEEALQIARVKDRKLEYQAHTSRVEHPQGPTMADERLPPAPTTTPEDPHLELLQRVTNQLDNLSINMVQGVRQQQPQPNNERMPNGPRRQPQRRDYFCYNCGEEGHGMYFCPHPRNFNAHAGRGRQQVTPPRARPPPQIQPQILQNPQMVAQPQVLQRSVSPQPVAEIPPLPNNNDSAVQPEQAEQQQRRPVVGDPVSSSGPSSSSSAGASPSASWPPPTASNVSSNSFFRQLFSEEDDGAAAAVTSSYAVDDLLLPPAAPASAFDTDSPADPVFQLGAFPMVDTFIQTATGSAGDPSDIDLAIDQPTRGGQLHTLEFVTLTDYDAIEPARADATPSTDDHGLKFQHHSKPNLRQLRRLADADYDETSAKKPKLRPADQQCTIVSAAGDPSQLHSLISKVNQSQSARSKEKLGERINALQQLVSPFGKTDTASVLSEAIGYIKFLQEQVQVLSSPYMKNPSTLTNTNRQDIGMQSASGLRSRGLCLVPVSCTATVANNNSFSIGADYWASTPNLSIATTTSTRYTASS
ncbi:hypothetical protein L7F22_048483 [Adiantum nelumboides]|nr:hypothetical protein [Adiantum nelumboides]